MLLAISALTRCDTKAHADRIPSPLSDGEVPTLEHHARLHATPTPNIVLAMRGRRSTIDITPQTSDSLSVSEDASQRSEATRVRAPRGSAFPAPSFEACAH